MGSCLTVIIPVLNAMPYLPEALASLEAQTFRDFEVCLWDNGSIDGSVEEARRWIPDRIPGRVVVGCPLPLHECLAAMVEEARTEFVARMDGDDVCLPHRLTRQMDFLAKNPEVSLVGGQIECIDPLGRILPKEAWASYSLTHSDIVSRMMILGPFNHPSIFFRRHAVLQVGNYKVPAPVEDHSLYLELVQGRRVANLPDVLTHYRIHPASICASAGKEGKHNQLALEQTAIQAAKVFGIRRSVFLNLRGKCHPVSILPLLKSAIFRSKNERVRGLDLLLSKDFIMAGRYMTSEKDLFSKAFWHFLEFAKKS